jgi:hypothetical protein
MLRDVAGDEVTRAQQHCLPQTQPDAHRSGTSTSAMSAAIADLPSGAHEQPSLLVMARRSEERCAAEGVRLRGGPG